MGYLLSWEITNQFNSKIDKFNWCVNKNSECTVIGSSLNSYSSSFINALLAFNFYVNSQPQLQMETLIDIT